MPKQSHSRDQTQPGGFGPKSRPWKKNPDHHQKPDERRPLDDLARDMARGYIIRDDQRDDFTSGFGSFP